MVGTRDLIRLAFHVERADASIVLIGDPDQHTAVDTGGVFKALAAREDDAVARLVENRRQRDPGERAAISAYRKHDVDASLEHYDAAGKVVRGDTAAATFDELVRDWWNDRRSGSTAPMLTGTNAARRALNDRARVLLKEEGVLRGDPLVVHGRELMVGDEVVARRNDRSLRAADGSEHVKNGGTGIVVSVDHRRGEVDVHFAGVGHVRIPHDYLAAGHLEHSYARTTYGVQGATLDRARYHPSDASRFEEGYVAITRATDATHLYVVEGAIEVDDEHHAIEPQPAGLATVVEALGRRRDDELATAGDPTALEAARLARSNTMQQLQDRCCQLDAVLSQQPPSVARELAEARRSLAALQQRREAMLAEKPSWKPSRRRQAARTVDSADRAIDHAGHRVTKLEADQAGHDEFMAAHQQESDERRLLAHAESARRLKITIEAVADPPTAVVEVLGTRPHSQRERLRWERAVYAAVLYADETGRQLQARATTAAELLGAAPDSALNRYTYGLIARELHAVLEQRAVEAGPTLGLGR